MGEPVGRLIEEGREEVLCDGTFNALEQRAYMGSYTLEVLPFCLEGVDKASIGSLWEAAGNRGELSYTVLPALELGFQPVGAGGITSQEATNVAVAVREAEVELGEGLLGHVKLSGVADEDALGGFREVSLCRA